MRDALFILAVIVMLLGLTAIKYRRQIVTLITFWRQFQAARERLRDSNSKPSVSGESATILVNWSRCGKWVAQTSAVRPSGTTFVCAEGCGVRERQVV